MSDTSGGGGFGPAGRQIRLKLKGEFGAARERARTAAAAGAEAENAKVAKAKTPGDTAGSVLPSVVWEPLDKEGLLEALLLPKELEYYLGRMATFIETARRSGLAGVAREFDVREVSQFPAIRRMIKIRAPGNSASKQKGSEHHNRAGAAFDSGSARWAQEISAIDDPTRISLAALVERIRADDEYERALLRSARLIIQEYGERVIRSMIREDDSFRRVADQRLISDLNAQLDAFFARYDTPNLWTAQKIGQTLGRLPDFLKR